MSPRYHSFIFFKIKLLVLWNHEVSLRHFENVLQLNHLLTAVGLLVVGVAARFNFRLSLQQFLIVEIVLDDVINIILIHPNHRTILIIILRGRYQVLLFFFGIGIWIGFFLNFLFLHVFLLLKIIQSLRLARTTVLPPALNFKYPQMLFREITLLELIVHARH